jgi:radical SAM family uncharacterized protein/radical SAM-linked protein
MVEKGVQDILPLVETPSRYLGTEPNRILKDPASVALFFGLAFPDLYEIGTSHFGMQILYRVLNDVPEIAAERFFAPAVDMADHLRERREPLRSLESGRPLKHFDIVGFSLLYELTYTNVLTMLELGGLALLSREREEGDPLVVAGGPATVNPEPVADFFDAMVIGDGEVTVAAMAREALSWKAAGETRRDLLRRWACLEGVYVPSLYTVSFDGGVQRILPEGEAPFPIRRSVVADLDDALFPDAPVVPYGRPVHDRLRLEISRGCSRGCRFCQAGMIYRPVRERRPETLLGLCETSLAATGYEDLSLLSLSTGDYSSLEPLLARIVFRYAPQRVAVSLPSVRAGTLTSDMMAIIRRVRKTGFTIAPEAGSQRLRDVINKNVTEADIFDTVGEAFAAGWRVIKLYFMTGLPTETRADLEAIVDLVDRLKATRPGRGRKGGLHVSVASFVPKPHTPFQWAPQDSPTVAAEKIEWLRRRIRGQGVRLKWQDPRVSRLEGALARGDRRMASWILSAYRRGCRFDSWSDHLRYDAWLEAAEDAGVDLDRVTGRTRTVEEPLPWDHIDIRVSGAFLREEWARALRGETTADCRGETCSGCGVCDFVTLEPVLHERMGIPESGIATPEPPEPALPAGEGGEETWALVFRKTGPARFFGHLEMANLFARALRRIEAPIAFTRGFHPKPKLVFRDPLPIGMESLAETAYLTLSRAVPFPDGVAALNRELPEGLAVLSCRQAPPRAHRFGDGDIHYRVRMSGQEPMAVRRLARFMESRRWPLRKRGKKGGERLLDLRAFVAGARLSDEGRLDLVLKRRENATVRPADLLREVFLLEETAVREARVVKTGETAPGASAS